MIEVIESHVVFDNPKPMLRSRHGYFPGIVVLLSGELLALVVIGWSVIGLFLVILGVGTVGRLQLLANGIPVEDKDPAFARIS